MVVEGVGDLKTKGEGGRSDGREKSLTKNREKEVRNETREIQDGKKTVFVLTLERWSNVSITVRTKRDVGKTHRTQRYCNQREGHGQADMSRTPVTVPGRRERSDESTTTVLGKETQTVTRTS